MRLLSHTDTVTRRGNMGYKRLARKADENIV